MSSIAFYDCDEGTDELTHESVYDAVECRLSNLDCDCWPDTLTVHAFERDEIQERERAGLALNLAERLLENLDDEHGNPDGGDNKLPQHAVFAARVFVDAVIAKYTVWSCSVVKGAEEQVNVAAWVKEHMPNWIADDSRVAAWVAERSTP
jgi:hypothetical protein